MTVIAALLAPSVGLRVDPYDRPRNVSPTPADALDTFTSLGMGIGLLGSQRTHSC